MHLGSILLAAGGSTRLGSPKQLLIYQGRTLLRHSAEAILATGCQPVVAVVGARAHEMRAELAPYPAVTVTENSHWERGMGSSLRLGLQTLSSLADSTMLDGVLLTLSDQPLVGPAALGRLLDAFAGGAITSRALAAATYNGILGVPAIFGRRYFDELLALRDEAGAKQVLVAHQHELIKVAMPEASLDIDTREQYEQLLSASQSPSAG